MSDVHSKDLKVFFGSAKFRVLSIFMRAKCLLKYESKKTVVSGHNYGLRAQNENYFRFLFVWGRHVSKDQYLANVPL